MILNGTRVKRLTSADVDYVSVLDSCKWKNQRQKAQGAHTNVLSVQMVRNDPFVLPVHASRNIGGQDGCKRKVKQEEVERDINHREILCKEIQWKQ